MSNPADYAKAIGPTPASALDFVLAPGRECRWSDPCIAVPYLYCRAGRSIFITHFRWQVAGSEVKVSRVAMVELFIKTAEFCALVSALLLKIVDSCTLGLDGKPTGDNERFAYDALVRVRSRFQPPLFLLSNFLSDLIAVEKTATILRSWSSLPSAEMLRRKLSTIIDTATPSALWPYLVFLQLGEDLAARTADRQMVDVLQSLLKIPLPSVDVPFYNGWKGDVLPPKPKKGGARAFFHRFGLPNLQTFSPSSPATPKGTACSSTTVTWLSPIRFTLHKIAHPVSDPYIALETDEGDPLRPFPDEKAQVLQA